MNMTQPIKDIEKLKIFKEYYEYREPNIRNHALLIFGLNTALRISDILHLCWGQVWDFEKNEAKSYLYLQEQKTKKNACIAINSEIHKILKRLFSSGSSESTLMPDTMIFKSRKGCNQPLSRIQAFRIIKKAAAYAGYPENVSCHSLRKTFGYHAWKQGISPAILVNIYNHSSYQITKRYLGIEQDEKDTAYLNVKL